MRVAAASGNSQRLLKLIRDTEGQGTSVNETVYDRNGEPRQQWLDR